MKKIFLISIITILTISSFAQLNNSWIDYSKTYYKFKVTADGLCRIPQSTLSSIGVGSTPAQNFQLWRNGKQVTIYTSVATGTLGSSDFIEFWGQMNDGKSDNQLYMIPASQLSSKYSIINDTGYYFLTVNTITSNNLRYTATSNIIPSTPPASDAYFMRKIEKFYKDILNQGNCMVIGERIYSSSFDVGEGWTSNAILTSAPLVEHIDNLNVYAAGPSNSVQFTIAAVGDGVQFRYLNAKLGATNVLPINNEMSFFSYHKDTANNLPLSILTSSNSIDVSLINNSTDIESRMVVGNFTLTYPATFNFNGQKNFSFDLAPSATGNYLVINNFNNNGIAPILYDATTNSRYLGDISVAGQVRFILPAYTVATRKLTLISQDNSNINSITSATTKTFINYASAANQGDYLIISHSTLNNNGAGVNYVDQYKQYRSSVSGGNYNAKVYDIDELTDQFAFGIKSHPGAIRDFLQFAKNQFSVTPKYAFLIGHGINYVEIKGNDANINLLNQLNLVPTFGWPASDILIASAPNTWVPIMPIGRIGAINGNEVGIYLDKVKQYEQAQQFSSPYIIDKAWMKNVIYGIGGNTDGETDQFVGYTNQYDKILRDTFFGANSQMFIKTSVGPVEQLQSQQISDKFAFGLAYVKYLGHASANTLALNLNSPENYSNNGKYPFFHISGCIVGDYYNTNGWLRLTNGYTGMSLSEKYIFANHRGAIGFLASTHYGIADYLNEYDTDIINNFGVNMYGNTIGSQIKAALQQIATTGGVNDYLRRINMEEMNLQGDPAIHINSTTKPDYAIEADQVKFTPDIISAADNNFKVDIAMYNLGKAISDSMRVVVKQTLPDNVTTRVLFDKKIKSIAYTDSLHLTVPILPTTDKGLNRLCISLDEGNKIDELYETNNTLCKDFYIFEDELRPISPYNFSIVNQQNISFYASTAFPLSGLKQYVMELDTTELFNSSFKKTYNVTSIGGVIQFTPSNLTFVDSTVYYWRTATIPTGTSNYIWNNMSFIYLANSTTGFNQSHYYQYLKDDYSNITLGNDRKFKYNPKNVPLIVTTGIYPYRYNNVNFSIQVDGADLQDGLAGPYANNAEILRFYIYDSATNSLKFNTPTGLYGSYPGVAINGTQHPGYFQFPIITAAQRKTVMDFIDLMPSGNTLAMVNAPTNSFTTFPSTWRNDTLIYGSGNSLYHKLKSVGWSMIDSFKTLVPFVFVFKKSSPIAINQTFGILPSDLLVVPFYVNGFEKGGDITWNKIGPSSNWTNLHWRGTNVEPAVNDSVTMKLFGIQNDGTIDLLATIRPAQDTSLSWIDAVKYPYLTLKMNNTDSINGTPNQLRYWRINGAYLPEGAVAPNILFTFRDSVEQGDKIDLKLAFKNISMVAFDSTMKINITIKDKNNIDHLINLPRGKRLISGDTLVISYTIDTKLYPGNNTIFIEVNPANHQNEQFHFNNILYKSLYVKPDTYNPLLDVTFDGVHILNKDIVAAKPSILINLKDESKFLALSDTSLFTVQIKYPDGTYHSYTIGNMMKFTPANLASGVNNATIELLPNLDQDGEYELIVTAKDVVGNQAGYLNYNITFRVISKAMISNLLNYPNPFTTSTAFVFTITGVEVPQNLRIEILTITGKIVKEITKEDLGSIHVGRNITDYKWDGTDMYGQKLANGVYLYRVLTNLNGKKLDKYTDTDNSDNTDKYFNKGYGKMVLIR